MSVKILFKKKYVAGGGGGVSLIQTNLYGVSHPTGVSDVTCVNSDFLYT